jgi:hypothetical protein
VLQRVEEDRKYAADLLSFVNSVDFSKTENPVLWQMARAYLAFMSKRNYEAVAALRVMEKHINRNHPLYQVSQLVKGLVLVAAQPQGKAIITDEVKPILLEQAERKNFKYLFGIGRELEEKGNTTLAALMFSKSDGADYENWHDIVHWKAKNDVRTMYSDYYWEYLGYIDAYYTIEQMHNLIDNVKKNQVRGTFDKWLYEESKKNMHELYRILGTKYYRQDKLSEAHKAFANIPHTKDFVFEADPFYQMSNSPEFTGTYPKVVRVNRTYIVDNLIKVLARAEDTAEPDRDLYYFLAANCYYNTTYYGKAWNMSRRFRSATQGYTGLPDDEDFFGCKKALKYYTLAYNHAKNEKFKALCMRMMVECEQNRLAFEHDINWLLNYKYDLQPEPNKLDKQFKKQYGRHYKELSSNCTAFNDYFKARR